MSVNNQRVIKATKFAVSTLFRLFRYFLPNSKRNISCYKHFFNCRNFCERNFSRFREFLLFSWKIISRNRNTFTVRESLSREILRNSLFIKIWPEFCVFLRKNSTFCSNITFTRESLSRKFCDFFSSRKFSRESLYD